MVVSQLLNPLFLNSMQPSLFDIPEKPIQSYTCPHCFAKHTVYTRKINVGQCWVLIALVRHNKTGWTHIEKFLSDIDAPRSFRADFHKLTHYKLLEKKNEKREDGNPDSGMYRITDKGVRFVNGEIEVPDAVILLDNEVKGFSDKYISIKEGLRNKFNYNELMGYD